MPSSKSEPSGRSGIRLLSSELAALGMDLHATLREEPRFLLDTRLLGALHQELFDQLEPEDARAALLQTGFLHGLRDALTLMRKGFEVGLPTETTGPMSPRIALRILRPRSSATGGLEVVGSWPEQREAHALRSHLGRRTEPSCAVSAGFTSGWLSGIYGADVLAVETHCHATGEETCAFLALDAAQWQGRPNPAGRAMLALLPFQPLRDVVLRHLEELPPPLPAPGLSQLESDAPVIHVWGPVMVVPFSGADESLRALELIGRDPGAREVRVVVIDLSGAIIDDGFGAAALEQVLDAAEGWGAEPILTGVSPLSEAVVADLSASHLVVSKDLPEAIALGFQIADLQRRAL